MTFVKEGFCRESLLDALGDEIRGGFLGALGFSAVKSVPHGRSQPNPELSRGFFLQFLFHSFGNVCILRLQAHLMRKPEEEAIEIGQHPSPL